MARTVDAAARARRRDEFLDAAQRLIETRGENRMSLQDVLDEAGTSRGAFYHYFGSKQELLSAVVERFGAALGAVLQPIVADPGLSAVDKLRGVIAGLTVRRDGEHDALVRTLRVWYSEGNVRVRQRVRAAIIDQLAGRFERIVRQGADEGTFEVSDPGMTARVLATLLQDLNDELADRIFVVEGREVDRAAVERTVVAYARALERVLSAPSGSVELDVARLSSWSDPG